MDLKTRLVSKAFRDENGCLISTRSPSQIYALIRVGEIVVYAHRLAYQLEYGDFDQSLYVLHKCDVPKCIEATHLFLGTKGDNNRDRAKKKRSAKRIEHLFSDEEIEDIKRFYIEGYSMRYIGELYGVGRTTIGYQIRNK